MRLDPVDATRKVGPPPALGRALVAGAAAGAVAALCAVAVGAALYSHSAPPVRSPVGSAFCASVIGGVLYWIFARWGRRPRRLLWVTALSAATAMSLVEVWLPAVLRPEPGGLRWVVGLTEPVTQVALALVVAWRHLTASPPNHSGGAAQWIRGPFLYAAVVMHFVVAVCAGTLIPWICGARGATDVGLPVRWHRISRAGRRRKHTPAASSPASKRGSAD